MTVKLPLDVENIFSSPVYSMIMPTYLKKLNEACDPHIEKAKKVNQPLIDQRNKNYKKDLKDFAFVHHSLDIREDPALQEFISFVKDTSYTILNEQGYDLTDHKIILKDLWVQEFPRAGGGYHWPHIHENCHISGFYFLKCSPKTSYPVFHDPRPAKIVTDLPLKKEENMYGYSRYEKKVLPGTFVFFNSYLLHEYLMDTGVEPFRFIHFNIKAYKDYEQFNTIIDAKG